VAVPEALRASGASVILHEDMFPAGTDDETWLRALAGRRDISVVTKDKQIKKRTLEHEAVLAGRVRLFILTAGGMNSREQADCFRRAVRRILRHSQQPGPFIATISASGAVTRIAMDRTILRRGGSR